MYYKVSTDQGCCLVTEEQVQGLVALFEGHSTGRITHYVVIMAAGVGQDDVTAGVGHLAGFGVVGVVVAVVFSPFLVTSGAAVVGGGGSQADQEQQGEQGTVLIHSLQEKGGRTLE